MNINHALITIKSIIPEALHHYHYDKLYSIPYINKENKLSFYHVILYKGNYAYMYMGNDGWINVYALNEKDIIERTLEIKNIVNYIKMCEENLKNNTRYIL